MELFILLFLSFTTVGLIATKSEKPNTIKKLPETRVIKQTRQMVYDTDVVQDWE